MPENEEIDIATIDLGEDVAIDLTDEKVDESPKKEEQTIEEAVIVDEEPKKEEKKSKKSSKRKGKAKDTVEEKSTPEPEIVDVDELKEEQKNETIEINFMDADQSEDFIRQKTKKSELKIEIGDSDEKESSAFEGKTVDEIREEIKREEEESGNRFKPEDFEEIANLIVGFIDLMFSALLRWYAKDTTDQPYSLNKTKKQKVTYSLTLLLIKHQKKMSIEMIFVLTIIGVYAGPAFAAHEHRKAVKRGDAPKRGKGNQGKK